MMNDVLATNAIESERMRSPLRELSIPLLVVLAAISLSAAGCERRATAAEIPASEVLAGIDSSDAPLILDVRTPAEYARGHVPGARNIAIDELAQRLGEIADHRGKEVVVYCERGPRAIKGSQLLLDAGFVEVRHLAGDMSGWREAGLPVDP